MSRFLPNGKHLRALGANITQLGTIACGQMRAHAPLSANIMPIFSYPYNIERADAMRYFILNHFGGVYADLDIECLQPIDDLIAPHGCILARQSAKHAQRHDESMLVCNSFMASEPKHPYCCC